jgi:hypothetical protein
MINKLKMFSLVTIAFLLYACSVTQQKTDAQSDTQMVDKNAIRDLNAQQTDIAPGHCRIIGTITNINSQLSGAGPEDPCSKAPCRAVVKVDTVLGYGSAFNGTVSAGDEIPLRFMFTTAATKPLGLKLETHLPGLQNSDRFQADIESKPRFGGGVDYAVYLYSKK